MDAEFGKWLATLGVGGVLAAFMFHFYRKDVRMYTDLWREAALENRVVIKEVTVAITELVTVVHILQARLDRAGRWERQTDREEGTHP